MFIEKLNKNQNGVYTLEEEKTIVNGVWEGLLDHDNVNQKTISIYTGSKFTGEKVENFFISTPSETPWKTHLKIFSTSLKVYVVYESTGDQVEAEDINNLQDVLVDEINRSTIEDDRLDTNIENEVLRATTKENDLEVKLNSEITRSTDKDNALDLKVDNEVTRSTTKDIALDAKIKAETTRASNAENAIQEDIDSYKTSNDVEVEQIKNRATALETNKTDKIYTDIELNKRYLKTQTYTKEEVLQKIQDVIGTAPAALDTLVEIAAALNNDANFAGTITNELSKKVDKVIGKSLSDENYSLAEKNKIAGIEIGANKYIHPPGTNPHNTNKADVGLSSVDNVQQATKVEFNAHNSDVIKHITTIERNAWNGKANVAQIPTKNSQLTNDSNFVTTAQLGQAGYGDMLKSVYDKNNNGKVDVAESADSVHWSGVSGKPSTFAPSTHNHDYQNAISTGSTADPNTTQESYILTNHVNSPGGGVFWHILTMFYGSKTGNRAQIAVTYNGTSPRMMIRHYYSSWNAWREILTKGAPLIWNDLRGI